MSVVGRQLAQLSVYFDDASRSRIKAMTREELEAEALDLMRLIKVTEERGETVEAQIGSTAANPRKGLTHDRADIMKELLDVALTAMCAYEHMNNYAGTVMEEFNRHVHHVVTRAGLNVLDGNTGNDGPRPRSANRAGLGPIESSLHLRGCQAVQGIGLPCSCNAPGTRDGIAGDAPCTVCGGDNRNGTHAALELVGHLRHGYMPEAS